MTIRINLRNLAHVFDKPVWTRAALPKSPLRHRFEDEWAYAFNSAGRALCSAGLGALSGVQIALTALLRVIERLHAALSKHAHKTGE